MGVIRRQAAKRSIVNYAGTAIAALATIAIYPLELRAYGLAQFLASMAIFIVPFTTLGTTSIIVRFFPEYAARQQKSSYLFNVLLLSFGVFFSVLAIVWIIDRPILEFMDLIGFDVRLMLEHKYAIAAFAGLYLLNMILALHCSNNKRIVVPAILQSLLLKIALPVLVFMVYRDVINLSEMVKLWLCVYAVQSLGLSLYLWHIGSLDIKPELTFFKPARIRKLTTYSFFVGLNSMGTVLTNRIDIIMVGTLLGVKEAGLYSISLFAANALQNPTASIIQIASPVISEAFQNQNQSRVADIYRQAGVNLLIVGILGYFVALGVLDPLLQFSPNYSEVQNAALIFGILGIARLVEMLSSVNQQIIMYSNYYRVTLLFALMTGAINIPLNYFLITRYGIIGAALSTVIAIALLQGAKVWFLAQTLRMHPFSKTTLKMLFVFAICLVVYLFVPMPSNPIAHMLLYGSVISAVYLLSLRMFNIDAEVIREVFKRLPPVLQKLNWLK